MSAKRPTALVAILMVAAACGGLRGPADTAPGRPDDGPGALPRAVADAAVRPDADVFLPPLDNYSTEEVDAGELEESLAHGAVRPVEVRRRLIVDEEGFTQGAITVVTFEPGGDDAEAYLEHQFGRAAQSAVEIGGVEMLRIDAQTRQVLAWVDPTFVVTFERAQEVDRKWLEELARATVATIRDAHTSRSL